MKVPRLVCCGSQSRDDDLDEDEVEAVQASSQISTVLRRLSMRKLKPNDTSSAIFLHGLSCWMQDMQDSLGEKWPRFRDETVAILQRHRLSDLSSAVKEIHSTGMKYPEIQDHLQHINQASMEGVALEALGTPENLQLQANRLLVNLSADTDMARKEIERGLSSGDSSGFSPSDVLSELQSSSDQSSFSRQSSRQSSSSCNGGKSSEAHGFFEIPIIVATDRRPLHMSSGPKRVFSDYRGHDITFAVTLVSVPDRYHRGPYISNSHWKYTKTRLGNVSHNKLLQMATVPLEKESFLHKLRAWSAEMKRDGIPAEATAFLHGYNTTLADSVRRMAQIAYTGGLAGPSLVFSWPSKGSVSAYTTDEANVMWALSHFRTFLKLLRCETGLDKLHLLAHSMGSRLAIYGLHGLRNDRHCQACTSAIVGQVVLAAPDFDLGEFSELVEDVRETCEGITIYCGEDDQALMLSRTLHGGYPRLGDLKGLRAGPAGVVQRILARADLVDTTGMDMGWLHHISLFTACMVVLDFAMILRGSCEALKRPYLQKAPFPVLDLDGSTRELYYWKFLNPKLERSSSGSSGGSGSSLSKKLRSAAQTLRLGSNVAPVTLPEGSVEAPEDGGAASHHDSVEIVKEE